MISRTLRAACTCLVGATFILPALPTMACGPDFSPPVLTQTSRPDGPPDAYAAGRLGVVLPSYVQSYLVIAYRYFSGKPLKVEEQSQFTALWNKYHPSDRQQLIGAGDSSDWDSALDAWERETGQYILNIKPNAGPNKGMVSIPGTYESYNNCYTDAYSTAARTLAARAAEFGESSAAIRSWVKSQVAVFQNCEAPGTGTPDPAESSLPRKIQKDRAYQIAAARFYSGDWDDAQKSFQRIAADSFSPWRATAALVAARCEIRKATLGTDDADARDAGFRAADDQLKKIIADPAFASVRNGAEELRGFVEFRSNPEGRAVDLSDVLARGESPALFGQNLDDYTRLMQQNGGSFIKDQTLRKKRDMIDWIVTFSYGGVSSAPYSFERWQQTDSLAWLAAALAHAKPDTPQLAVMLQASESVPENSPAYLTLAFERDRLLAETNREAQARQDLDRALAMPEDRIPQSSRNLLTALRMKLARNLDDLLRFAPRTAAASWPDSADLLGIPTQTAAGQPMFDADASITITEKLPLRMLIETSQSNVLAENLRRQVVIAAWTRAVLLRYDAAAQQVEPIVVELVPEMKDDFAPYAAAKDTDARRHAALLILLNTPGFEPYVGTRYSRTAWGWDGAKTEGLKEINSYRDNWWSPAAAQKQASNSYPNPLEFTPDFSGALRLIYTDGNVPAPSFLSSAQRDTAEKEWKALSDLPSASDWLTDVALDWAKADPNDPRVPEALHLAVRATRYGRSDDKTADYSRQAFEMLHRHYPNSEWTKQTPYWFR